MTSLNNKYIEKLVVTIYYLECMKNNDKTIKLVKKLMGNDKLTKIKTVRSLTLQKIDDKILSSVSMYTNLWQRSFYIKTTLKTIERHFSTIVINLLKMSMKIYVTSEYTEGDSMIDLNYILHYL